MNGDGDGEPRKCAGDHLTAEIRDQKSHPSGSSTTLYIRSGTPRDDRTPSRGHGDVGAPDGPEPDGDFAGLG